MTERDEQGFVKDIDAVINTMEGEEKSVPEKVYEILNLPFSVEDVLKVENFVIKETNSNVDIRDDLYKLAILNEQLNGFDDMFKSKLEERHNEKVNEIVEALNVRMEGVNNMYDENLENVQAVSPTVEQPVETPTPQLNVINPEAPVETMEVGVAQPIATFEAAPVVDPTQYAAPTTYGEIPAMEPAFSPDLTVPTMEAPVMEAPVMEAPVEVAPVVAAPVEYAEPVIAPVMETPVMETPAEVAPVVAPVEYAAPAVEPAMAPVVEAPVMEAPVEVAPVVAPVEYAEPVMEIPAAEPVAVEPVEPVVETTDANDFVDFINGHDFSNVAPEAPTEENDFVDFLNNNTFAMPEDNMDTPEEKNDFVDFINNLPVDAYVEPEANEAPEIPKVEEVAPEEVNEVSDVVPEEAVDNEKDDEEDEEVRNIINRYDRLKELEIKVHNNQKRLAQLHEEAERVQNDIDNDQEEIKKLVA